MYVICLNVLIFVQCCNKLYCQNLSICLSIYLSIYLSISLSIYLQARSKQCMIGLAEINIKLPVGGLGRAASPPTGSGAEPWEPNAFQQKYNENGFKLLTIGGEQACCRTVALLYTPKSDCVVSAVKTKLRPARLLVRQKPDQPDRLLRP